MGEWVQKFPAESAWQRRHLKTFCPREFTKYYVNSQKHIWFTSVDIVGVMLLWKSLYSGWLLVYAREKSLFKRCMKPHHLSRLENYYDKCGGGLSNLSICCGKSVSYLWPNDQKCDFIHSFMKNCCKQMYYIHDQKWRQVSCKKAASNKVRA